MTQAMLKVGMGAALGVFVGDYLASQYGGTDATKQKAFRYGGAAVAAILVHKFA